MDDVGEDERTIELSSIAAIFPELVIDPSDPYHATLELPVTPIKPLRICFDQPTAGTGLPQLPTPPTSVEDGRKQENAVTVQETSNGETHELEHLPPVKLNLNLDDNYPVKDPPRVHLIVEQQWLPRKKLRELENDCARLWEELGRDQVVYSYIDHLQQQAENAFGMAADAEVLNLPADLKLTLLDFDLRIKREKFERGTFDCGICLEPKKGINCHRLLLCGHVFCTACLVDFYSSCINEGAIDAVKCTDPGCGKDTSIEPLRKKRKQDRTLNPSELLQIQLSQELVQRYVRLKRKKKLEISKNTIYCPRQWCQGPAYPEHRQQKAIDNFDDFSDSENDTSEDVPKSHSDLLSIPMNNRLAICSDCNYAFCLVCRKTWHGSHKSAQALCNPRNPKEMAAEEQASLEYLKRYSTPCPTCNAPAQKTMGCNHMICFRCNTHFCYLCSAYLMEDNPYRHFNDQKSTCYMRLWELEGGDGEGAANHWAGIGGEGAAWDDDDSSDAEAEPLEPAAVDDVERPVPHRIAGAPAPHNMDRDSDSDDSEPAPDIRRERAIEFVNFANPGGGRRINIPDEEIIPPAAPEPPRNMRRGQGQQPNRQRRRINEPPHNRRPQHQQRQERIQADHGHVPQGPRAAADFAAFAGVPANAAHHRPRDAVDDDDVNADDEIADNIAQLYLPRAAPGQNNHDAANPAPVRAMGLERFLELARRDAEDEWDSDELEDADEAVWDFELDGHGNAGRNANDRVQRGRARPNEAGVEARVARR